jgi:hypothetical protein
VAALGLKAEDVPKEFLGLHLAEQASFQETIEWVEAWNVVEHRRLEAERLERLGMYINLNDDDDDPSSSPPPCRRCGDPGQGCNSFLSRRRSRIPTTTRSTR